MKRSIVVCALLFSVALADEAKKLQDMTVSAQKFEEKLVEVPIAMDVYDDVKLEDLNIRVYEDLSHFTSNFTIFVAGTGLTFPIIRGIAADTAMDTTNATVFVDGVPYLGTFGNYIPMDNIEKIEILKGPQGTIYGKNAYAGVVNIITKKPTNTTEAKVNMKLGSDKLREFSGSASGAVIKDKFYIGVSANHYEKDGFIKNLYTNKYENYRESNFGKLYLRFTPNDNLEINLINQYVENDDGAPSMLPLVNGEAVSKTTNSDFEGMSNPKIWNNSLKVDYNWQDYTISSILTHRKYDEYNQYDADFTSTNDPMMIHVTNELSKKEYSFNTSFLAQKENFTFLAGIYADDLQNNLVTKANSFGLTDAETNSNTYSFFINNDYKFNEKLSLILGARYDYDKIDFEDMINNTKDSNSYGEISPKIALKYKINQNFMTYASIAKGYRMGGYFLLTPPGHDEKYDPETMISYEVGLKSQFENLTFNTSAFYMDISDKQVVTNITHLSYIDNAAKATSKGFEIEANYEILNGLSVFGNFGYADSKLDDFKDALGDYSGNQVPFASKYTYALGVTYRHGSGFFITANAKSLSKFYSDKANLDKTDGYTLFDAKIGYESENFDIYLYGTNLTDEDGGYNDAPLRLLSSPREIGLSFTYRF